MENRKVVLIMAFKDRLKQARQNKGMTQEQLAHEIGIAKSTVAGYEVGNREPTMNKILEIMQVLDTDANFLWQDEMEDIKNSPDPVETVSEEEELQSLIVDLTELFRKHGYLEDNGDISDETLRLMKALVDFLDTYFSVE